jgi:hypothetical protein
MIEVYVGVGVLFAGLARTINIYGVCTVFLAGELPNIRSYTVYVYTVIHIWSYTEYIYSSGLP